YEEMAVIAERFGCPRSEQPATYAAFRDYFAEQVEAMDVTDVGRRLGADVLAPKLPAKLHVPLRPLLAVHRLVAVGTLPEPIRRRFGFSWDERRQRHLDRVHAAARAYHRAVPRPVRIAPTHLQGRFLLAQARRHVAAWEQKVAPTPTAA
ncbi:MAG: DUF2236 domain-containing protein, partial [Acidimicrobiia bacterium]|nr:DUF2236 domain-containing protein [Acidimicrobiia bacterium]